MARFKHGDYLVYSGSWSKTIPRNAVVRVKRPSGKRTIVEAMREDGRVVSLALANRYLEVARFLF